MKLQNLRLRRIIRENHASAIVYVAAHPFIPGREQRDNLVCSLSHHQVFTILDLCDDMSDLGLRV